MVIRWTAAGAVAAPRTVQVRVQRGYPGRVRAGAPVPTRSMSTAEIAANLRYFTEGMRGPRSLPCDALVLSGVGVAGRADTPELLRLARALGMRRVVLHAGVEDLPTLEPGRFEGLVDTLVLPVPPTRAREAVGALAAAREAGLAVRAHVVLPEEDPGDLAEVVRVLAEARPAGLTLTYPFPIAGAPDRAPPVAVAAPALRAALAEAGRRGLPAEVKGLPACLLGADPRTRRSANRWYVDADHQRGAALLFFPDVVAFHKDDDCRFCAADGACDGFFAARLRGPGAPRLDPGAPPFRSRGGP